MSVDSTDLLPRPGSPMLAMPPDLPPTFPARVRSPGLLAAAGVIALYFILQFLAGILLGVLIGLAISIVTVARGNSPATIRSHVTDMLQQPNIKLLLIGLALLLAAGLLLLLARKRWPALWSLATPPGFGFRHPQRAGEYGIGVALGLATPILGGLLTQLLAHGQQVPQDVKQMLVGTAPAMQVFFMLTIVAIGPLVEELIFRGVLLSALLRHMRATWAILLSAAVFALVHLPGLSFLWYALPNLALLGVAAAWLRLRAGSIWPSVVLHGTNNLLAVIAWLFSMHGAG